MAQTLLHVLCNDLVGYAQKLLSGLGRHCFFAGPPGQYLGYASIKIDDNYFYLNRNWRNVAMHYMSRAPKAQSEAHQLLKTPFDQPLRVSVVTSPRALGFQHSNKSKRRWERGIASFVAGLRRLPYINGRRRAPPLPFLIAILLASIWFFWSFILPIKIYGFLPFPTVYPWGNLRYKI